MSRGTTSEKVVGERVYEVHELTRVEGEGSLRLRIPLNIFSGGSHPQLSDLDRRMTDPVPIRSTTGASPVRSTTVLGTTPQ